MMAREDEMPKVLSYLHYKWMTPIPAAMLNVSIRTVTGYSYDITQQNNVPLY